MRLIIEEHKYPAETVNDVLYGISTLHDIEGKVSINYVGYYYNPTLKDCVFILPKVLLEDTFEGEMVFGHCKPEDIIDIENQSLLTKEEYNFIYELSVWIYRAITVFRDSKVNSPIVKQQNVQQMNKGRLRQCNTFLDIILALLKFNKENRDFFFFILKNQHSGFNKINWTQTICHSSAIMSGNEPVYIDIINKKRRVNFDEELLVIFFSILNFISKTYGFPADICFGYELITGEKFRNYINGFGKTRLMQIKYKYFSDKALYLWELCYAFFDQSKKINVETDEREYLLVQNFNIVFEAMIDELVGDKFSDKDKNLNELKYQPDGKMVDHLYQWSDLTNNDDADKTVYYIGDSKYYKKNVAVGKESVYKQFTYARNVIQWNIDLFNDENSETKNHVKLRDDVTEGYNIIPNFFISAQQNTLGKEDNIKLTDKSEKYYFSRQFENRLFDRDTFLIAHYDVNFLFVVALYGRNNRNEKSAWKRKVREMFRKEIQAMLKEKFLFYALTPHEDVNAEQYVRENFQFLLGKIFRPFEDVDGQQYYSLALRNPEALTTDAPKNLKAKLESENESVRQIVSQYFYLAECELGRNPATLDKLPKVIHSETVNISKDFRTRYFFEAHLKTTFLVGCYKSADHLNWIFGRNGKRDDMYNVRIDKDREGYIPKYRAKKAPAFLLLYNYENPTTEGLMTFKIHNAADTPFEFMVKTKYPNPIGDYVSYILEQEQITFGDIDIARFLEDYKKSTTDYINGVPIFTTGEKLIEYRY